MSEDHSDGHGEFLIELVEIETLLAENGEPLGVVTGGVFGKGAVFGGSAGGCDIDIDIRGSGGGNSHQNEGDCCRPRTFLFNHGFSKERTFQPG